MKYNTDLNKILTAVSAEFGIPEDIISTPSIRTRPVTHARHLVIYLACKMTWRSKMEIATRLNHTDHAAVYYGLNRITGFLVDGNEEVKKQVGGLIKKLEAGPHGVLVHEAARTKA